MNEYQRMMLLVDDDPDDQDIVAEALQEAGVNVKLKTLSDGQQLLNFLYGKGEFADVPREDRMPSLILLDINMPRLNGIEALREIKSDDRLKVIPIVMLTTSRSEEDIVRSYDLGCNSFVTKPGMFDALIDLMQTLSKYWLNYVEMPDMQRLIDETLSGEDDK